MRFSRQLLAVLLVGGSVACTALLGDFSVGPGGENGGADGEAGEAGADATSDGARPDDAGADAPRDSAPPTPDGSFVSLVTFGSTNASPPANMRVAYDAKGNLFVLFAYSIPTEVLGVPLTTVGNFDIGVAKIAPDGSKVWVKSFGSAAAESSGGLAVDGAGDVYISGTTEGTGIDFGGASAALTRQSNRYLGWIAKLSGATGDAIKAIRIDGPGGHQGASCLSLAARGPKIAALCTVYGPATFPMQPGGVETAVTAPDGPTSTVGFVAAVLDPSLNALWANGFGSAQYDFPASIAMAANGDVLLAANIALGQSATFSDAKGTASLALGAGGYAMLLRLSASAGAALWSRTIRHDGNGAVNQLNFNDAIIDSMGRVVAGGFVTGTVPVGAKTATALGETDILLATFDGALGTPLDVKTYGNTSAEQASALAVDVFDAVAVVGSYRSTGASIGPHALPDPLGGTTNGFVYRSAPGGLTPYWAAGFTTALTGTFLQSWSVATDPSTGRVASAGTYRGLFNFGDGNPVRSALDGGAYNVWVVQRQP
jgi:hypothetical protein